MCCLRMAVMQCPPNFAQIALSNSELLTFSEIHDNSRHHLWFSSHVHLEHSVMLIVWCLSSIYNLVQISAILTKINTFDDVSRINFRFRILVRWSSPHARGASSHKIWCRHMYPGQSYWHFPEIQDGGRRRLGFSVYVNFAIPAFDCVVFVFCRKFVSNICYSHWDRRTYASDVHLMTSRELTSGFDFWSRGHLRMAMVHLPI